MLYKALKEQHNPVSRSIFMNTMSLLPLIVMVTGLGVQASSSIDMPYAYGLVVMDLSHFGTTGNQYFGIHLTGWEDTEIEIWIPSTGFSQSVTLTSDNLWNWRNEYELSDASMVDAVANGFRIRSSRPVNVMATRYSHYQYTLTSYEAFPLTSVSTSFFISPYLRRITNPGYEAMYWILSGDTETEFRVYKYDKNTNIPLLKSSGTLSPHHIVKYESPSPDVDYLVGVEINTTAPVTVYSGNKKTFISYDHGGYVPAILQMPPTENVSSFYIVGPIQSEGTSYVFSIFVVFTQENTEAEIRFSTSQSVTLVRSSHGCSCSSSAGRCTISCSSPITKGAYIEVRATYPQYPVIVECSKPCLTSILKHSMTISYQRYSGYMSLVATPVLLERPVNFFLLIIYDQQNPVQRAYVNVVTKTNKLSCLTIDGKPYAALQEIDLAEISAVEEWTSVMMQVAPGSHTVMCDDSAAPVAVHIHGQAIKTACSICYSSSYGFSPSTYSVEMENGAETTTVSSTTTTTTTATTTTNTTTTTTSTATPSTEPVLTSPTAQTTTSHGSVKEDKMTDVDMATITLVAVTLLAVIVGITLISLRRSNTAKRGLGNGLQSAILDPTQDTRRLNQYTPESLKGRRTDAETQEHVYINHVSQNVMDQESRADTGQEMYEPLNVPPKKPPKPNLTAPKESDLTVYENVA